MKYRALIFLASCSALCAVVLDAQVVVPTYIWTGGGGADGSVELAANWREASPPVPLRDGSENLEFGEVTGSTQEDVLIPSTAAFLNITFTGEDRPRYTFQGTGNPQLILAGNVTASLGGDNRSAILLSNLELGLTAGSHIIDVENIVSVFAKVVDFDGVSSIIKRGSGGLYLSGTDASSTFSGGVTVEEGILFLSRRSITQEGLLISGRPAQELSLSITARRSTRLTGSPRSTTPSACLAALSCSMV